jgi:hypothetical protein
VVGRRGEQNIHDVKKIDATFEKGVLKVKIAKPAELLMKAIDVPVR